MFVYILVVPPLRSVYLLNPSVTQANKWGVVNRVATTHPSILLFLLLEWRNNFNPSLSI